MSNGKANQKTGPLKMRVYLAAHYADETGELFFINPISGERESVKDCKYGSISFCPRNVNPQQKNRGASRSGQPPADSVESESIGLPGLPVTLSQSQVRAWIESRCYAQQKNTRGQKL